VTEFANNNSRNRYEMTVDGAVAFINYQMKDGAVALTHTEVPESLSGQGVGSTEHSERYPRPRAQTHTLLHFRPKLSGEAPRISGHRLAAGVSPRTSVQWPDPGRRPLAPFRLP
jgi:hypothetical protein